MTTEYGVMINGQLIKHKQYIEGDKPLTYTQEPYQQGYRAIYNWNESENEITQVWELVEDDGEYEEPTPTAEEILNILTGESE